MLVGSLPYDSYILVARPLIRTAAWEFAMIDAGYGSEGFYFNDTGLQWNVNDGGFIGWLGDCVLESHIACG
jgi:hypothetical protein